MPIKIITPVSTLPDGEHCFKITGQKKLTIRRKIIIDKQEILAKKGCVFLCSESSYFESFPGDYEVRVEYEHSRAISFLEGYGGTPCKNRDSCEDWDDCYNDNCDCWEQP